MTAAASAFAFAALVVAWLVVAVASGVFLLVVAVVEGIVAIPLAVAARIVR